MAYVTKNTAVVYVTKESTEGIAVAPAGTDAVSITTDFEMNGEKELVERNNLTTSIIKEIPRVGIKSATLSLAVEAKANTVEGVAPEAALLFEAALGTVRSQTNTATTLTTTNLTTIPVSAVTGFVAGDFVMIKDTNITGGYHISPITAAAANGTNEDTVTLLIPSPVAPTNGSSIAKFTTFATANSGHPSLTVTTYLEDAIKLQATGAKVGSLSLEGFETGQIGSFNFALTGMGYEETLAASALTAVYDAATPPLVLSACVYKDGVAIPVNGFSLSLENTLGRITSTCSANGVIGQKVTEQAISGSFTPYMDTTSVALFSAFDANTEFSMCAILKNPGATAGTFKEVIGVYLPRCIITAMPKADQDGVMTYSIEFTAGYSTTVGTALTIGFI
jgi:hypothetical protein